MIAVSPSGRYGSRLGTKRITLIRSSFINFSNSEIVYGCRRREILECRRTAPVPCICHLFHTIMKTISPGFSAYFPSLLQENDTLLVLIACYKSTQGIIPLSHAGNHKCICSLPRDHWDKGNPGLSPSSPLPATHIHISKISSQQINRTKGK